MLSSLLFAKISHQLHATRKQILSLILQNGRKISIQFKILDCLERMSMPTRKVGFTCLTVYTVTYLSMFKVRRLNKI